MQANAIKVLVYGERNGGGSGFGKKGDDLAESNQCAFTTNRFYKNYGSRGFMQEFRIILAERLRFQRVRSMQENPCLPLFMFLWSFQFWLSVW
jgi:hypothetical protein